MAVVRRLRLSGKLSFGNCDGVFWDFNATVLRLSMTSAILLGTCPGFASLARTAPATTTVEDDGFPSHTSTQRENR
jgi:hypothetical protein